MRYEDRIYCAVIAFSLFALYICRLLVKTNMFIEFKRELKCINFEIGRNRGREKKYWKKKKVMLFLSLLPFGKYKY